MEAYGPTDTAKRDAGFVQLRDAYEEKLRSGNLYQDPTIYPGLGSPRCLSLLNPNPEREEWTITPVLHDATAVAGAGIGAILNAVHGLNTGIPQLQNRVKGPKWPPFAVGLPPLLLFSGASIAFGGYALPKFAQFTLISCRCTCYEVDFAFPKFASNGAVVGSETPGRLLISPTAGVVMLLWGRRL